MSQINQDSELPIQPLLEGLVRNASEQLEVFDSSNFVRSELVKACALLPCVPALAVASQLVRLLMGYSAHPILPWILWGSLTLAGPFVWLFIRIVKTQFKVDRVRALRATDSALNASERLETADEFQQLARKTAWNQAAIEDANEWAEKGQSVELANQAKDASPIPLRSAGISIGLLFVAALLSLLSTGANAKQSAVDSPLADASSAKSPTREDDPAPALTEEENQPEKERERSEKSPKSQRAVNRQGTSGAAIPDSAEESSGKLSEGETRESQQSANPSNAKGSPSASGQPSKDEQQSKKKRKNSAKKPSKRDPKKKEREEQEKPSGATAGQGSSKGSDNNAAPSDWASTSQSATPEDDDIEDEEDVNDEEEEQESRGGVQPNMRDRRAPVNRDLQIGFGNNRPNPDANGRGGPGGQKKSRGVASLILGVPIPDRVNGQPNKGRIRITQQRITPEREETDPTAAQDRGGRSNEPGLIFRPIANAKANTEIKRYFLKRRSDSSTQNQPSPTSTNPTESP